VLRRTLIDCNCHNPDDRPGYKFVTEVINMQPENESATTNVSPTAKKLLEIFRGKDAPQLDEFGSMNYVLPEDSAAGLGKLAELGMNDGAQLNVLFSTPGFSLTSIWFKPGFALPIHSHNSDCLYYVISGQVIMGTETLSAGDGLFLPADTWYSYAAGPEGAELLEFRHAEKFDFKARSGVPKHWEKLAEACLKNRDGWKTAVRPMRVL
jgi:quercetin dioxygenase-like cupin family protein